MRNINKQSDEFSGRQPIESDASELVRLSVRTLHQTSEFGIYREM